MHVEDLTCQGLRVRVCVCVRVLPKMFILPKLLIQVPCLRLVTHVQSSTYRLTDSRSYCRMNFVPPLAHSLIVVSLCGLL